MPIVDRLAGQRDRVIRLAAIALGVSILCAAAHGQTASAPTPIAKFDDVAGKWVGRANSHNVSLEISTVGRFTARYAFGGESGDARLEDGALVIPLVEHGGVLQLIWNGETLEGPGVIAGKTWAVSLARTGSTARTN